MNAYCVVSSSVVSRMSETNLLDFCDIAACNIHVKRCHKVQSVKLNNTGTVSAGCNANKTAFIMGLQVLFPSIILHTLKIKHQQTTTLRNNLYDNQDNNTATFF